MKLIHIVILKFNNPKQTTICSFLYVNFQVFRKFNLFLLYTVPNIIIGME